MLNARRERGEEDHKVEGMSEEEIAELGDESYVPLFPPRIFVPYFRYLSCNAT